MNHGERSHTYYKKEDVFHYANHVFMPFQNKIINTTKVIVEQGLVQQRSSLIDTLKGYLVIRGSSMNIAKLTRTLYDNLGQGLVQLGQYTEQRRITTMEGRRHMLTPHQGAKGS